MDRRRNNAAPSCSAPERARRASRLERHGARFSLLICDQVHYLADAPDGETRARMDALIIARATHRLGLTATGW